VVVPAESSDGGSVDVVDVPSEEPLDSGLLFPSSGIPAPLPVGAVGVPASVGVVGVPASVGVVGATVATLGVVGASVATVGVVGVAFVGGEPGPGATALEAPAFGSPGSTNTGAFTGGAAVPAA
jgi:hypothetical protein